MREPVTGVYSGVKVCEEPLDKGSGNETPEDDRYFSPGRPKSANNLPLLCCIWQTPQKPKKVELRFRQVKMLRLDSAQPPYLHHLISAQPPLSTRSSSLVTLARPPTSSSLRLTDRSFRYASPCLWNQLPSSLRQPHLSTSVSVLPVHASTTSPHSVNSPLSPSITPSFFHSRLKTYLFHKSFPP